MLNPFKAFCDLCLTPHRRCYAVYRLVPNSSVRRFRSALAVLCYPCTKNEHGAFRADAQHLPTTPTTGVA